MDFVFLSNTCIGHQMYVEMELNKQYNTPLIGTLFVDDYDFIKYCTNYTYYMNVEPVFGKSRGNMLWHKGELSKNSEYPVMLLDDIEIHWIHENISDLDKLLDKYNRRNERFKSLLLEEKIKIIAILSYSQFLSDHTDIPTVINDYFKSNNTLELIFIGPSKYKNNVTLCTNNVYLPITKWDGFKHRRDHNCLYTINDQNLVRNTAISWLHSKYGETIR
jgi:hypothetical protein